jgi:hypothetical protein
MRKLSKALNPAFVLLCEILLLIAAIVGFELYMLAAGQRRVEALSQENNKTELVTGRFESELLGLKASQSKVNALFNRLNDSILNIRKTGRDSLSPGDPNQEPSAIQQLIEAGAVAQLSRVPTGEAATIYEAGSSQLELHRLIPLLVEEENSNAFLYFDHLTISRPLSVAPFSMEPTYLNARFSIRLLSNR